MKILLLIDTLCPGGAETHVLTLARSLQARGHDVTILSDEGPLQKAALSHRIRCLRPRRPFSGRFCFLLGNLGFLRHLQEEESFDVLHAHTRKTALLLRVFRCFFRPSLAQYFKKRPLPYRRRSLRRVLMPLCIVTCHAKFRPRWRRLSYWGEKTLAVSLDLRRHLQAAFGVEEQRITVIENGIDIDHFRPTARPRENQLRLVLASRLDKDCSAAAHITLEKFEEWRQRAAVLGKSLYLTLVGGGECFADVAQRAKRINRALGMTCVRAIGATDDPAAVLKEGDLFIGVSRAAIEAMCCGLGVILAGNEGFGGILSPDNFAHFAAGNFCCRGEAALSADKLDAAFNSWLTTDAREREDRRQDVCRMARARFDSARMALATEQFYITAKEDRPPLRLLILGYAGCHNLGDDIILRRLIEQWQDKPAPRHPAASQSAVLPARLTLCAAVGDRSEARRLFGGIELIRRGRVWEVWRALGRADALVLGGGSLLQTCSRHGRLSLFYYLGWMVGARWRACPFHLVANGVGPLRNGLCRRAVKLMLRKAAGISVRDERSRRLLLSMGLSPDRLCRRPDPALLLCPPSEERCRAVAASCLNESAKSAKGVVCVVPKSMNEQELDSICLFLERLWQKEGRYPLFFSLDRDNDSAVCRHMIARLGIGQWIAASDEETVMCLFSQAEAVISARLHGLILAYVTGTPAIALPDSRDNVKATDFARSVGQAVWNVSHASIPPFFETNSAQENS